MSARRRPRSSLLAQQQPLIKSKKSGSGARQGANTGATAGRTTANRQAKSAAARSHGYGNDGLTVEEREAERQAREAERERRRKERRLDELERGTASSGALAEHHVGNVLPASTSAAAIAGLLAGQQQKNQDRFDDITPASSGASSAQSKKQSAELRRLLTHRRGLRPLLEDAAANPLFRAAPVNYVTAVTRVTRSYPAHRAMGPLCSVCGYWGDARCVRCGERLCGRRCIATHDETRCERPQ